MAAAVFGSPLKALVRLAAYGGLTLLLMPAQAFAVWFDLHFKRTLPIWYHERCCWILGFQVEVRGEQSTVHPTLYACNHVSYLDIMVLGSLIEGSFVAKSEVARWPLFGWLARLQRSVFIERRGQKVAQYRDELNQRLENDDDLILFPEGTSGDGNQVLPFKSALFSVAERRPHDRPLLVQPVSIAYTRLDGVPMGRYLRPLFAWYGDMELGIHLWQVAGLGWATVVVEFHQPVTIEAFGTRKMLSEYCQGQVAAGMSTALSGRPQRSPLAIPAGVSASNV
jgi:1-acyl-sn-glycerol-3-phosphate acyltransferase